MTFDRAELYSLLESFYNLTKIKVVIKDADFNDIEAVPSENCQFCSHLRQNPEADYLCRKNEEDYGQQCKTSGKLICYKCHAGLTEAILPLKISGLNIGYIMLGQVFEESSGYSQILRYAEKFTGSDMAEYLFKITKKSSDEIAHAAQILEACACYLLTKELVHTDTGEIAVKITDYINSNLNRDIPINELLSHFSVSRNALYKISNKYFGMSVSKYIRKRRVEYAVSLIKSGVPIGTAADLSGFCDYSYFTKVVKAETGTLPSKIKPN